MTMCVATSTTFYYLKTLTNLRNFIAKYTNFTVPTSILLYTVTNFNNCKKFYSKINYNVYILQR